MADATYELRLRGAVSSLALRIFEEGDLRSDTLLSGVIQDQAALDGLLERIATSASRSSTSTKSPTPGKLDPPAEDTTGGAGTVMIDIEEESASVGRLP